MAPVADEGEEAPVGDELASEDEVVVVVVVVVVETSMPRPSNIFSRSARPDSWREMLTLLL